MPKRKRSALAKRARAIQAKTGKPYTAALTEARAADPQAAERARHYAARLAARQRQHDEEAIL